MNQFGNFMNFMQNFQRFAQNPAQYMMQMGFDQKIAGDPNAIIQQMMRNGQISQQQYNNARWTAQQIQNNPMFSQYMNKK